METKSHNKHLGILIFIGFLLIIIGIVSYIVINYNSDQAEVKRRMDEVRESYKTFKTDVESFNSIREDIYTNVITDNMYYQTLKDNDASYKEIFNNYKDSLEKIEKRFKRAYEEINEISKYNYVVVNDDLSLAVKKVDSILEAEKCRVDRIEEVYLDSKEEQIHEALLDDIKDFDNSKIELN